MSDRKPLTDKDGEVRELLAADFADFHPAAEVLPRSLGGKLALARKSQQETPAKIRISLTLSHDIVERFRAAGEDWEGGIEEALREWLDTHPIG
jgi:uncharacterized protein (DUF4415 family)